MDIFDSLKLQTARLSAYRDGIYELDEWEGFTCTECGNQELTASASDGDDLLETVCSKCGSETVTSDSETDWSKVEEKLPEEYLSGEAMETDFPECPHCGHDMKESSNTQTLSFGDRSVKVHKSCADSVWESEIESPMWSDSFTPEHYEAAADYLRTFDSIGEVITNDGKMYGFGEMYIHTNYCTTRVVDDVIDAFGGRIVCASVARENDENQFSCVSQHGTCFEILIDFCSDTPTDMPPEYLGRYSHDGPMWTADHFIMDSDICQPVFDADFSMTPSKKPETVPEKLRDD